MLESNHAIPGVSVEESATLQGTMHLASSRLSFDDDLREALDGSYAVLIPGDPHWPVSLNELGDRAPYALWARGATSFLAEPTYARLTVAGSRAATDYGVSVTAELVTEAARREQVIVTGGDYGIDAAARSGSALIAREAARLGRGRSPRLRAWARTNCCAKARHGSSRAPTTSQSSPLNRGRPWGDGRHGA